MPLIAYRPYVQTIYYSDCLSTRACAAQIMAIRQLDNITTNQVQLQSIVRPIGSELANSQSKPAYIDFRFVVKNS
uniref:Uncharacterized protein n=1 Tax=Trichobilharzia regenti TaxID=157069 RepID=A0AA85JIJ1_TRIRE|nr:unnamed protein product [Trichobilharzia regenti]